MRFAFDVMDWHKTLRVVPSKQHKRFLFYIDGNLRTVQATWLDKPWAADAAEVSYTICGVHEHVGARLELGHGSKFKKCPPLFFAEEQEPPPFFGASLLLGAPPFLAFFLQIASAAVSSRTFFLNMVFPIIEDLLYKIEDVIIHEKRTFSEINH